MPYNRKLIKRNLIFVSFCIIPFKFAFIHFAIDPFTKSEKKIYRNSSAKIPMWMLCTVCFVGNYFHLYEFNCRKICVCMWLDCRSFACNCALKVFKWWYQEKKIWKRFAVSHLKSLKLDCFKRSITMISIHLPRSIQHCGQHLLRFLFFYIISHFWCFFVSIIDGFLNDKSWIRNNGHRDSCMVNPVPMSTLIKFN